MSEAGAKLRTVHGYLVLQLLALGLYGALWGVLRRHMLYAQRTVQTSLLYDRIRISAVARQMLHVPFTSPDFHAGNSPRLFLP